MVAPPTSGPRLVLMLTEAWTLVDGRDLRRLVALAPEAEKAGADGVLAGEHVVLGPHADRVGPAANEREWIGPHNQSSRFPHPNALHLLSAMASVTTTLRLIAAGVTTPLRHALVIAKELATLDLISEGRLVVAPIAGLTEDEYGALGVPFHERGRILDEQLEVWERAWRDEVVGYDGRYYAFADVAFEPKAWRPSGPELWIGAMRLHDNALRRTVRYASGYFPVFPPTDEELERLSAALAAAGRSRADLELAMLAGWKTTFPEGEVLKPLGPTLDEAQEQMSRGTSTFVLKAAQFVDDPDQFGDFCREAVVGLQARWDDVNR